MGVRGRTDKRVKCDEMQRLTLGRQSYILVRFCARFWKKKAAFLLFRAGGSVKYTVNLYVCKKCLAFVGVNSLSLNCVVCLFFETVCIR